MKSASLLALALCITLAPVLQAQTYPGPPVLTVVGPLSCGIRIYSPGTVQTYCFWAPPGVAPTTLCNALDNITGNAPATSISHSCFANTAQVNYEVTWLAYPATPGPAITYQIAQWLFPAVGIPPPQTTQVGTL